MNEILLKKLEEIAGSPRQANGELIFPRCPFCGDTKGHFYVEATTGRYHCFKCGVGGGPYSLAKHLGIALVPKALSPVQEIKEAAAGLFRHYLLENNIIAEKARKWLADRGIPINLLKGFTTGDRKVIRFLPVGLHPGDSRLIDDLQKRGYTQDEINHAGILLRSRFRGWAGGLVFIYYTSPTNVGRFKIRKVGQPANTAIWLPGDESGVFGLNLGEWRTKEVTVVEGEFDALLLQTHSILNEGATTTVVALSGGGAGPATETLIKNGIKTIYIFPDQDEGGMNFVLNVAQAARKHETMIYILSLPPGPWKDPADWVNAGMPSREIIRENKEILGEALGRLLLKYHLTEDIEESRHTIISKIRKWQLNPLDRQHLAAKLAPRLQVDVNVLDEELRKISADILGWDIEIKGVKQEIGDTVRTIFDTNLGEISLPTQQLISPLPFQKKALELRKVLPTPKKADWAAWIQQVLTEAEIVDAPANLTTKYQVEDILIGLFRMAEPGNTIHVESEAVLSEDEKEYWVTWPIIKQELKAQGNDNIDNQKLANALIALGGTSKRIRLTSGSRYRVWAFSAQKWNDKYYDYVAPKADQTGQKEEEGEELEIPF